MEQYLDTLKHILAHGKMTKNRTDTDTISVFGHQIRFDLSKGFPATTTKKLAFLAVVSELLWFLEGSGDERRLAEIRYGKDRSELKDKNTIWSSNADADYWKHKAKHEGDLGRVYGVQWRHWRTPEHTIDYKPEKPRAVFKEVDQIANIIDTIKNNPNDRRIILSAWNPGELDQMALPPCHAFAQFNVRGNKLDCQLYQRSVDAGLGCPFNIASYSLLTHMIAHVTGLQAGDFIHTMGDLHLYENHLDNIDKQLQRTPLPLPTLWLNPDVTDIDDFTMDDIKLLEYNSHGPINLDMAQ